jgi:protein-S-isoprenylcysteine O-methyltransferase Ste14
LQNIIASLTIIALLGMVIIRVLMLKRRGVIAMNFGKIDKTDFLIPPFALFYFYLIFAKTYALPSVSKHVIFISGVSSWVGVVFCLIGMAFFSLSLVAFGNSFRVGIDIKGPDRLITSGVFAVTRNPIYVTFWMVLFGQFLVFPNWLLLLYIGAATWLFHRQLLREEEFLIKHYGAEYEDYCSRVRRYL